MQSPKSHHPSVKIASYSARSTIGMSNNTIFLHSYNHLIQLRSPSIAGYLILHVSNNPRPAQRPMAHGSKATTMLNTPGTVPNLAGPGANGSGPPGRADWAWESRGVEQVGSSNRCPTFGQRSSLQTRAERHFKRPSLPSWSWNALRSL